MKTFITTLLFLGLALSSYSQEKNEGPMEIKELPTVVIKRIGNDFSTYIPDQNPDINVRTLQEKFVAYDVGRNLEGNETYLVIMNHDKNSLVATYDEKGKLTRVVENYEKVKLPNDVIYSVYKTYPEWNIVNDKFLYTQVKGNVIKKQYDLKIQKGKEILKLKVHPDGTIMKP
ncbi:MAG TPA: hypothetical protein VL859_06565 [Flavobacterium sp.]|nr:hypothetical protein [Flavobacterium sp.]